MEGLRHLLIVDADTMIWKSSNSAERTITWDERIYSRYFYKKEAIAELGMMIDGLLIDLGELTPDIIPVVVLCITHGESFRVDHIPCYKKNRKHIHRPMGNYVIKDNMINHPEKFKEELLENVNAPIERLHFTYQPRLEADDLVSVHADYWHNYNKKFVPIIYSEDKDLLQVPGVHMGRGEKLFGISKRVGRYNMWMQVLCGDTSDNYPGAKGVGKVKAEKILPPHTDDIYEDNSKVFNEIIVPAFEKANGTYEDALANTRCAMLLTADLFNFSSKTHTDWKPSGVTNE